MSDIGPTRSVRGDRIERDQIVPALIRVLDANPDAGVAAVAADGRFCAMPTEVPLGGHEVLGGRAGIDLVAAESRGVVLEQFRQLGDRGAIEVDVRAASGSPARYALFDTTDTYGVVILVLIEGEPDGTRRPLEVLADLAPVRPRFGRVRRTDVGELLDVDDATLGMLRYTREQFSVLETSATVHPDDYGTVVNQWFDLLTLPPGNARRCRVRYHCGDGSWLWVELTVTNQLDDPDQPHMVSEMVDISDEMDAMDEVWRSRELLLRLTQALPLGVLQIEADGSVVYTNERLQHIVGVPRSEAAIDHLGNVIDDDRETVLRALDHALASGSDVDLEYRFKPVGSHGIRFAQMTVRALRDRTDAITGLIVCVTDVTDSTRMRKELEVRAAFDELTRCFNRATVMGEIERALEQVGQGVAVVFVDLDEFKPINDRLGHAAGDELLKSVAAALQQVVRTNDVVGRLGGDEFIVLCPDVISRELALEIGGRIADAVQFDAAVGGELVAVRSSMGVSWTGEAGVSADALVAAADVAMYESKRARDNRPVLAPDPSPDR